MPCIKQEPESDVELQSASFIGDDEFDDFEDLGQSEEIQQLRELKKKHNELKTLQTQLKAEKPVGEEASLGPIRKVSPHDALRLGYTVLVVDTNFMLSSLDIFRLTIANAWSIVTPKSLLTSYQY